MRRLCLPDSLSTSDADASMPDVAHMLDGEQRLSLIATRWWSRSYIEHVALLVVTSYKATSEDSKNGLISDGGLMAHAARRQQMPLSSIK